jgi:protein-tyrosine phosphatase
MSGFEDQFEDPFQMNEGEEGENNEGGFIPHTFTSSNFRLAVAHEEMNSRRRNTMEDVHRIVPILDESLPNHSYIGIYDGHGGRQIVDFLETKLEQNLANELKLNDNAGIEERVTRFVSCVYF